MTEVNGLNGEPQGMTLRDYARVIVRRLWLILLIVVVATGAAFFFSWRQTKMYQATAKIMYAPQLNVADPLTGQTSVDPNARQAELDGVATVISSPDMQQRGAGLVRQQEPAPAKFTVTAQVESDTTNTAASTVVDINGASSAPQTAEIAANAYATAFIEWRKEVEIGQIGSALAALQAQMAGFKTPVDKQSTDYLILAQRVQDLQIRKATVTGSFRLAVPASLPTAPYAPRPLRSAILGFAVGLFAAIGLAFLLEQFDTRLRGQEEVARILRVPIIGRIPRIRQSADKQPVVTLSDPDGHVAEAFRVLRGNLDFLAVDGDVHSLAITSSQQGEGKSVTACNLAVTAARAGRRVILVDGDLRRPHVHEYLGLKNEYGLTTVVVDKRKPLEALQRLDVVKPAEEGRDRQEDARQPIRLYALTSGPKAPNPGEIVASTKFAELIEEYVRHNALVIVDTPAFLAVGDAAAIAGAVDGVLFVVDPSKVKRPTLLAAAEQLQHLPTRLLGTVVLHHHGRSTSYSYGYGPGSGYYGYTSGNGNGNGSRPRRRVRSGSLS